jgi:hypothetical protein
LNKVQIAGILDVKGAFDDRLGSFEGRMMKELSAGIYVFEKTRKAAN